MANLSSFETKLADNKKDREITQVDFPYTIGYRSATQKRVIQSFGPIQKKKKGTKRKEGKLKKQRISKMHLKSATSPISSLINKS